MPTEELQIFQTMFPNEQACWDYLVRARWPEGTTCPQCGKTMARIQTRKLFQCKRCQLQRSPTAGTLFHKSRVPLQTWFLAIAIWATSKDLSLRSLQAKLKIKSYRTLWEMKRKFYRKLIDDEQLFKAQLLSGVAQEASRDASSYYLKELASWYGQRFRWKETFDRLILICIQG